MFRNGQLSHQNWKNVKKNRGLPCLSALSVVYNAVSNFRIQLAQITQVLWWVSFPLITLVFPPIFQFVYLDKWAKNQLFWKPNLLVDECSDMTDNGYHRFKTTQELNLKPHVEVTVASLSMTNSINLTKTTTTLLLHVTTSIFMSLSLVSTPFTTSSNSFVAIRPLFFLFAGPLIYQKIIIIHAQIGCPKKLMAKMHMLLLFLVIKERWLSQGVIAQGRIYRLIRRLPSGMLHFPWNRIVKKKPLTL